MVSEHTPGPWTYRPPGVQLGLAVIASNGHVIYSDRHTEETEANARLIAAAPELLAALEQLSDYVGGADTAEGHPCQVAIRAIAKARGE